ncbi:SET and MYND domain-containing protein 4-like [Daphnia carinata]|uniref:SET and MYND domain-containing protein 4-like n=1 Tax=Daphnia carinata TaxID=120202 RepID=UPI00257BD4F5|nr:SET and MYND domain-containing protein 4-like [Daphnia carinata]
MDFDNLFTQICHDLEEAGGVSEMSARFSTCTSDAQRISFIMATTAVGKRLQEPLELAKQEMCSPPKCQSLSASHRAEGNNHYQKKLNWKAISSYNRSVMVGEGESLALAYANRSAVFHDMSDWLHSLRDIQLALDQGYPKHLEHKLRERQGNCWQELGHVTQAFKSFNLAKELLASAGQQHKDKLISITSKIRKLGDVMEVTECMSNATSIEQEIIKKRRLAPELNRDRNILLPAASTSIELTDSVDRGRCLVATEDIHIGTTVIVEKAFASILLTEFKESHCHHCLHWTPGPVPCHRCSQVGFCSTVCRDEAWAAYHRSECGLTDVFRRTRVGNNGLLAVRTVLKTGRQKILMAEQQQECIDKVYDSSDYGTIHRLVGNTSRRSVADLFRRAVMAVYLTSLMQPDNDPDQVLAAAVLRLLQSYPCNAHEIGHLAVPLPGTSRRAHHPLQQFRLCEIGSAAMPVLSLINHSCDPNVVRVCYGDVIAIKVIRRIARGEELLDNYGYHYALHERSERQASLSKQYYFRCDCRPCQKDWPLYADSPRLANRPDLSRVVDRYVKLAWCDPDGPPEASEIAPLFVECLDAMETSVQLPVQDYSNAQEGLKHYFALSATLSRHLVV